MIVAVVLVIYLQIIRIVAVEDHPVALLSRSLIIRMSAGPGRLERKGSSSGQESGRFILLTAELEKLYCSIRGTDIILATHVYFHCREFRSYDCYVNFFGVRDISRVSGNHGLLPNWRFWYQISHTRLNLFVENIHNLLLRCQSLSSKFLDAMIGFTNVDDVHWKSEMCPFHKGLKVLKRWPSSIIDTCKSFLKLSLKDKQEAIVISIVCFCSDIVLTYYTAQFLVSFFLKWMSQWHCRSFSVNVTDAACIHIM